MKNQHLDVLKLVTQRPKRKADAVRKPNKNSNGDPEIAVRSVKLYADTIALSLGNIEDSVKAIQRTIKELRSPKAALKLYRTKTGMKTLEALEKKVAQVTGKLEMLEVDFKSLQKAK
jgi:hypothetical protein